MSIFHLPLFKSSEKEKLLLGRKNIGTEYDPPPPPSRTPKVTPVSTADVYVLTQTVHMSCRNRWKQFTPFVIRISTLLLSVAGSL
jgi:hypothetical protein